MYPLIVANEKKIQDILGSTEYNTFIFYHRDYAVHTSFLFIGTGSDAYQLMLTTRGVCLRKAYPTRTWIASGKTVSLGVMPRANLVSLLLTNRLVTARMRIYYTCTVFVNQWKESIAALCSKDVDNN